MENIELNNMTLQIEPGRNSISFANGQRMSINCSEAMVLKELILHHGEVVPRKLLVRCGWGREEAIGCNSLAVAVSNLRKIVALDGVSIINVPRLGYRLEIAKCEKELVVSTVEKHRLDKQPTRLAPLRSGVAIVCGLLLLFWLISIVFYLYRSWVFVDCVDLENNIACDVGGVTINYRADERFNYLTPAEYAEGQQDEMG